MSDTLLALTEADADMLRDMLRVQRNMRGVAHNSVVGICVAQPEVASRAAATSPRRTVGELFAVLVEKDGGSDGNATTAATYTYTVRSLAGTTLGTEVAQARPRSLGKVTYQKVWQPVAPSTMAACSSSVPCACIRGMSSRAMKGKVTNTVASTMPGTAKMILMSCACSHGPNQPWAPNIST